MSSRPEPWEKGERMHPEEVKKGKKRYFKTTVSEVGVSVREFEENESEDTPPVRVGVG
jgi:hypothetical protein